MRFRPGLRHRGPARAGVFALRTTAAAAMLLGTMTVGINAAGAQADEDAGTYESPTFGYTLEWDADLWSVELDDEASDDYPRDLLQLEDADGTTALFIEASEEDWSDTDACVEGLFEEIGIDPADGEAVEDEDGEVFEVSDDDRSLAAYIFEIELEDGETQDQVRLIECRADTDSDLIVGFTVLSGIVDDYAGTGYPMVEEIADSLAFAGGGGSDDDDATAEASDEDDATEEASDDATAEASDDEDATEEANDEDATEEATEEASDDDAGGDTGVDGSSYVSPTYAYSLSWDEDVWTVEDESSEDEVDSLTLESDLLTMYLVGYNSGDGDPETCLDNYLTVLDDRGDGDAEIVVGDEGELIFPSEDGMSLSAYLFYSVDGESFASYVTCITLDDESVMGVEFTGAPDVLAEDAASEQINGIFEDLFLA